MSLLEDLQDEISNPNEMVRIIASEIDAIKLVNAEQAGITQSIVDGETNVAPSGDAVFDALALKANVADLGELASQDAAANVAVLGTTTDLVGVDGTGSNAAPVVETEARLDAIEAKLDSLISALVSAGIMAAP